MGCGIQTYCNWQAGLEEERASKQILDHRHFLGCTMIKLEIIDKELK